MEMWWRVQFFCQYMLQIDGEGGGWMCCCKDQLEIEWLV